MTKMVLAVLLLAATVAAPGASAEESPTHCTFSVVVSLSPGLSFVPSSGEFTSGGQTGTVTCDGIVRGVQPTGPGTLGVTGRYGIQDPDTCLDGEGEGRFSFTFPTAEGEGRRSNVFRFPSVCSAPSPAAPQASSPATASPARSTCSRRRGTASSPR